MKTVCIKLIFLHDTVHIPINNFLNIQLQEVLLYYIDCRRKMKYINSEIFEALMKIPHFFIPQFLAHLS